MDSAAEGMKHHPPVLVALDGSPASERAIAPAAEQAHAIGGMLHLVHVHELTTALSRDPNAATVIGVLARVETQARLSTLADRLGAKGIRALPVLLEGEVEPTLLRYIARIQPAFVFMAARGPEGVTRSRPGSITDTVLRASSAPVIVLPLEGSPAPTFPVRNVLTGLDGSPFGEHVLPAILDLQPRVESVWLMTVLPEPERGRAEALAYLNDIAQRFAAQDVQAHTILVAGSQPADRIIEQCRQHEIDLIALTTHTQPSDVPAALGSCTDAVLRSSTLPVLVVNPGNPLAPERLAAIEQLAHA